MQTQPSEAVNGEIVPLDDLLRDDRRRRMY
jgi:hypothetical protein